MPQNAVDRSTTETTTVFRPNATSRRAGDDIRMSTHWLLTPYASVNGFTIGLLFMDMLYDNLDDLCVGGAPSGKFAMNEETGEILATSFRENGSFIVGWIKCVASCERIREVLEFDAPSPGNFPSRLLKRNSFYERRNCRLCGCLNGDGDLLEPCSGTPRIRLTDPGTFRNFGLKGFRGSYFGSVNKVLYDPQSNRPLKRQLVPIFVDLRHSIPAIQEKLRLKLRRGLVSFGTAPRISSGLFISDELRYLLEAGGENDPAKLLRRRRGKRGPALNKRQKAITNGNSQGIQGTLRRRNEDERNRDSIKFQRKQRNRESARRANEARRLQIQSTRKELEHLKKFVVPTLHARIKELQGNNSALREQLDRKPIDDELNSLSFEAESFLASSDVTYEDLVEDFSAPF